MKLADRMSRLGTETAFEVLAKAKALEAQGKNVIHLEIGEPDFNTPNNIVEAGVRSLRNGRTHYTPAAGIPELRNAIVQDVKRWRGVETTPERCVVTPGAKPIMYFVIIAMVQEGDEVIYPNPGFPIYESVIEFAGAKAVPLPLKEEKGFSFDIEDLKALVTDKTKLIIINTPANPTGGILSKNDIKAIADIARERNIMVLSDEVYKNIIYDGEHASIMAEPGMEDLTILLDGFSKTYSMTGWRLGFGVMKEELAQRVVQLMINSNSCTATFVQDAGVEALTGPQEECDKMVQEFAKRREVIVKGLNELPGVSCIMPKGAFYVFPNVSKVPISSRELAARILYEGHVAVLSGTAFGKYGDGYLRLSYANSIANIEEGLNRIYKVLKSI
ncbi:pyridoxal phosphate-dependent aminotransferase [candidate division KSB1 bacterium]|nr:pyridoxal phosphate-dependent aminotransferase [candidate division KSB1 bacterium]